MSVISLNEVTSPGAFGAIFSAIKDFRSEVAKAKSTGELKKSSIARQAKDLVMSFPVLASDQIEPKDAFIVVKALERNFTTMLQQLFTSEYLRGTSGRDIIAQWHNNIDDQMDVSDYMDYAAGAVSALDNKGLGGALVRSANSLFKMGIYESADLKNDFADQSKKFYKEENLSETSINDYFVSSDYRGYHVKKLPVNEANIPILYSKQQYADAASDTNIDAYLNPGKGQKVRIDAMKAADSNEIQKAQLLQTQQRDMDNYNFKNRDYNYMRARDQNDRAYDRKYRSTRDQLADKRYKEEQKYQKSKDRFNQSMAVKQYELDKQRFRNQQDMERQRMNAEYITKQLLPTDVQKCNELVPTMLIVRYAVDDDSSIETVREFVAGVKCRLIAVPGQEMAEAIISYKENSIDKLQLSRATSKEISFSKDFVGAVQQAKIDAIKDNKLASSNTWRLLQSRAAKSNASRLLHGRNTAAAITSLVISKQEVDYIKMNYSIDLLNPREAMQIMNKYNLIAIVVTDAATEVARMLFDGNRMYSSYPYTALEREGRDGLTGRQVVNLISKK